MRAEEKVVWVCKDVRMGGVGVRVEEEVVWVCKDVGMGGMSVKVEEEVMWVCKGVGIGDIGANIVWARLLARQVGVSVDLDLIGVTDKTNPEPSV